MPSSSIPFSPKLFTLSTAYSLQSSEVRFGDQGNIHSTFANMNTEAMKASVGMGFGRIMKLAYHLDLHLEIQTDGMPASSGLPARFQSGLMA